MNTTTPEAIEYIARAVACIKAAAEISPHLVTKLGTPHCLLQDVLRELEGITGPCSHDHHGERATAVVDSFPAPRASAAGASREGV